MIRDLKWEYYVRLVCPLCFRSRWVLYRSAALLDRVLNLTWEFRCPVHGRMREKPFEAKVRKQPNL